MNSQRVVHKVFFWILVLRRFLLLRETLMNDTLTGMNLGKLKGLVFLLYLLIQWLVKWHFCCLFYVFKKSLFANRFTKLLQTHRFSIQNLPFARSCGTFKVSVPLYWWLTSAVRTGMRGESFANKIHFVQSEEGFFSKSRILIGSYLGIRSGV